MIIIYQLIITLLVGLALAKFLKMFIHPYTYNQLRKSKELSVYDSAEDFDFDRFQRKVSRRLPIINMSEDLEQDMVNKIKRLGLDTTPKEVRRLQLLYFITALVASLIAYVFISDLISTIILVMSLYAWRYPVIHIDNLTLKRDQAIDIELPEMYAVLYYVYKRSPSVNLVSKIQSYIKDSSDLFYKEMMLFIEDSRSGEQHALTKFKERVPLPVVSRFCDIMSNRLEGYDNRPSMEGFKKDMDDKRLAREDEILKDLANRLNTISWVGVMIPMGIIVIIYFASQFVSIFQ